MKVQIELEPTELVALAQAMRAILTQQPAGEVSATAFALQGLIATQNNGRSSPSPTPAQLPPPTVLPTRQNQGGRRGRKAKAGTEPQVVSTTDAQPDLERNSNDRGHL
jgi:hypothetical protein